MSTAYYVSRTELLQWLNSTFNFEYANIQQCGSGAAYCQIFDTINPGSVQMDRVDWNATQDYDRIKNYKLLQKAFDKNNIDKKFDASKLAKGQLQDNLEFLQWIKHFWEVHTGNFDSQEAMEFVSRRRSSGELGARSGNVRVQRRVSGSSRHSLGAGPGPTQSQASRGGGPPSVGSQDVALKKQVAELKAKQDEYATVLEEMERERNFYYEKLREIEVLCQEKEAATTDPELLQSILGILYANNDEAP